MRFLDPEEVATLAHSIDERYAAVIWLGAYGGLRAGELFGLRARRIDPLRRMVDVAETLVEVRGVHHFGPPKTRAARRQVPIPAFVAGPLAEHLGALDVKRDDLVFPAPAGGPVRLSLWRRRFWHPAVEAAGLAPLRVHDLPHTAVAFWIAAGLTPGRHRQAGRAHLGRHRPGPLRPFGARERGRGRPAPRGSGAIG